MSPIPLGILAASGVGAAVAGSYDLLATEVLSGSQSTVTFSNLNSSYSSDYQHLQLRTVARSNRSSAVDSIGMQFNGATTSGTYAWHFLRGLNTDETSAAALNQSHMLINTIQGNSGVSNSYGVAVTNILDPFNSNKNTTIKSLDGWNDSAESVIELISGLYIATTVIDSISLFSRASSNFLAGSRFSLYGMKV